MENSNMTYKELHEKFMQNHSGTSVADTISIQSPIPVTIFLSVYIVQCIGGYVEKKTSYIQLFLFMTEFLVLVVSQILLFTLPEYLVYIEFPMYCTGLCLIVYICLHYIKETIIHKESSMLLRKTPLGGKRPYITYFRTSVNLTTTICILAVDFVTFPRKLAKSETYGFSLMDTGVGYFVICNALTGHHSYKNESNFYTRLMLVYKQLKQNSVLLFIGFLRIIFTKNVDYQMRVSEYGVHWNFFITLAFVRVFSTLLLSFINANKVKYLTIIVILIHQVILSSGVEDWVISDTPRDTIFKANREGVVSLLGYIGLYLISVELGNTLKLKSTTIEKDGKIFLKLLMYSIVFYALVLVLDNYFRCSRRLANITYIIWIVMLTLYLLSWCLLFELALRLSNGPKRLKDNHNLVPTILSSINHNALPYFLLSNVLTGVVNLSVETLFVNRMYSIFILVIYMFTSCVIVKSLLIMNIKLL